MPLYLDGTPLPAKSRTDPLVLLGSIAETLGKQGRVLHHVVVNDQVVQEDWLQALTNISADDTLSFMSVPASQLLEESIATTVEVLPQLAVDLKQVAYYLQTGQDDRAFPLISTAVEGLQSYMQLLNLMLQYVPTQAANTQTQVAVLTHWLQRLMAAWRQENLVAMADYLLYELEPQIRRGHHWLQTLVAQEV